MILVIQFLKEWFSFDRYSGSFYFHRDLILIIEESGLMNCLFKEFHF